MSDMSPEEFTELVRRSNSWSDLVRRCGLPLSPAGSDRNRRVSAMKKKVLSLGLDTQHFRYKQRTEQMFQISVQEFKEHVCLSHSWSELSCRCGQPVKAGCSCNISVERLLKQKVLFLKLDTQHFTSMPVTNI
jgi:hypothetical protein